MSRRRAPSPTRQLDLNRVGAQSCGGGYDQRLDDGTECKPTSLSLIYFLDHPPEDVLTPPLDDAAPPRVALLSRGDDGADSMPLRYFWSSISQHFSHAPFHVYAHDDDNDCY